MSIPDHVRKNFQTQLRAATRSCTQYRQRAAGNRAAMRSPIRVGSWQFSPLFLIKPAESLQVEAVPVVEVDAFLFQQALLESVAAIAG